MTARRREAFQALFVAAATAGAAYGSIQAIFSSGEAVAHDDARRPDRVCADARR